MTEFRAILLVFAVVSIGTLAACFALAVTHAPGAIYAVVMVLIIGVGADSCSRIGERYESKQRCLEKRREREEILLSR